MSLVYLSINLARQTFIKQFYPSNNVLIITGHKISQSSKLHSLTKLQLYHHTDLPEMYSTNISNKRVVGGFILVDHGSGLRELMSFNLF